MIQGHLWEIMAKQKIRLKDLAAQADISEKTLIELKYERSKNVALETINKLCAVLNLTIRISGQPVSIFSVEKKIVW